MRLSVGNLKNGGHPPHYFPISLDKKHESARADVLYFAAEAAGLADSAAAFSFWALFLALVSAAFCFRS